jgi:nucleotide-binding universal stress UspA family protein
VVGVDGSPSSLKALEWAAGQAELTDATLEVVSTWEWPVSYGWAFTFPPDYDVATNAQKAIDPIIEDLRVSHPKLSLSSKVVQGHPAPALVEESAGADLLVVGSRGHGEFVGMLVGSTGEHCVAHAHCPVVVVREVTEDQ